MNFALWIEVATATATVLSGFLVPMVAVFGALIAYRQWETEQKRLKLELFDRRAAVYEAARTFVSSIRASGRTSPESEFQYRSGIQGAQWLYDQDVVELLDAIWRNAADLHALQSELEGLPAGEERSKNIRDARDLKTQLADQLAFLEKKVAPYLKLRH